MTAGTSAVRIYVVFNPLEALRVATEVKLPRLGQGMESGTIVRWLKSEGEAMAKREPPFELDTDKVTQEVEAEVDGVLLEILVPSGDVEVGTTIALIGVTGEQASTGSDEAPPPVVEATSKPPQIPLSFLARTVLQNPLPLQSLLQRQ